MRCYCLCLESRGLGVTNQKQLQPCLVLSLPLSDGVGCVGGCITVMCSLLLNGGDPDPCLFRAGVGCVCPPLMSLELWPWAFLLPEVGSSEGGGTLSPPSTALPWSDSWSQPLAVLGCSCVPFHPQIVPVSVCHVPWVVPGHQASACLLLGTAMELALAEGSWRAVPGRGERVQRRGQH